MVPRKLRYHRGICLPKWLYSSLRRTFGCCDSHCWHTLSDAVRRRAGVPATDHGSDSHGVVARPTRRRCTSTVPSMASCLCSCYLGEVRTRRAAWIGGGSGSHGTVVLSKSRAAECRWLTRTYGKHSPKTRLICMPEAVPRHSSVPYAYMYIGSYPQLWLLCRLAT